MHDGQNVFDDSTSFAGEWGVDETLDSISSHGKEIIVVAVDHGGQKRINEYCPYDMEKFGKGEGNQYVDFLVKDLKPFIDKNYRTEKDKQNTFIAGSSMGGLISMYAVLKYPGVFGGAGVFSRYKNKRQEGQCKNLFLLWQAGRRDHGAGHDKGF